MYSSLLGLRPNYELLHPGYELDFRLFGSNLSRQFIHLSSGKVPSFYFSVTLEF